MTYSNEGLVSILAAISLLYSGPPRTSAHLPTSVPPVWNGPQTCPDYLPPQACTQPPYLPAFAHYDDLIRGA